MKAFLAFLLMIGIASATPFWNTKFIDTPGNVGSFSSMDHDGKDVFIAYSDTSLGYPNYALKFTKSADGGGTWETSTILSSDSPGDYISAETESGVLYISYYATYWGDLRLAKSSDGGSVWSVTTVDNYFEDSTAKSVGRYNSLEVVGNSIFISYYDSYTGALKFAKSTDGGERWTVKTVDYGKFSAMKAVDQNTIYIAYAAGSKSDTLKIAKSADGGTTWTVNQVDRESYIPSSYWGFDHISMDAEGSYVYISYYNMPYGRLRVAKSTTGGMGGWSISTADVSADSGKFSSLDIAGSAVFVSYYSNLYQDLRIARSFDGNSWSQYHIDTNGDVGKYTSIKAVNSSYVLASYYDATYGELKLAEFAEATSSATTSSTTTTLSPTTTLSSTTTTTLSPTTSTATLSSTTTTLPATTSTLSATTTTVNTNPSTTTTLSDNTSITIIVPDNASNSTTTSTATLSSTTTTLPATTTTQETTTTTLKKVIVPVEDIVPVDVPADLPNVTVPDHVEGKFDNRTDEEQLGDGGRADRIENDISARGRIQELKADEEAILEIKREEIDIRKVSVQVDEDIEDMEVTVKRLAKKPDEVEKPDAAVYSYLDIDSTKKDMIKKADIEFRVDADWIRNNGNENDVRLNHYRDGGWEELKTEKIGKDGNDVRYTAETESFSVFVISIAIPVSGSAPSVDQTPSIQTAPSGSIVIYLIIGALLASTLAMLGFIVVKTGILTKKR